MNDNTHQIGIGFFGSVMASISHELKNRIAVMKEHAGLLKDYSAMASRGGEINVERLGRLGQALGEQVGLADDILKNMNHLAHSVDEIFRTSDLNEVLKLSAALANRPAHQHRVNLQFLPPESDISVTTVPFFLMNLIWMCLIALFQFGETPRTVALSTERTDAGQNLIRMRMDVAEAETETSLTLPSDLYLLAEALEAEIEWKPSERELLIHLPVDLANPGRLDNFGLALASSKAGGGCD